MSPGFNFNSFFIYFAFKIAFRKWVVMDGAGWLVSLVMIVVIVEGFYKRKIWERDISNLSQVLQLVFSRTGS